MKNLDKEISLDQLEINQEAEIIRLEKDCEGMQRRRLMDLGLIHGSDIKMILKNPLSDPKAYSIKGTTLALRNDQAKRIIVKLKTPA